MVSDAFPDGNIHNNVAITIVSAKYILYSNNNIVIILHFKNGINYSYYLSNGRQKIEMETGNFRKTYDILVRVDKNFLLDKYYGELYYTDKSITQINIYGDNKMIVEIKCYKKES
jgi:hypothetical protein